MAHSKVDDELWEEFHGVVNMTSRSGAETEETPDQAGPAVGRQVLAILGKRRADLTGEDAAVMAGVVDRVRTQRGSEWQPTAGSQGWRHGLMDLGHDPLKPD